MSRDVSTIFQGASAIALHPHDSRPLRSHDLGGSHHRASRRSQSPKAGNAAKTAGSNVTASNLRSSHTTDEDDANADDDANDDDDDDGDGVSGLNQEDEDEPEVKAPLHSFSSDQAHTGLSRVQATTADLQNVLGPATEQEHGVGPRRDSLASHTTSKKRTFSEADLSMHDRDDSSELLNDDAVRKKVHRERGSNSAAVVVGPTCNKNIDQDDEYDADIEMLQNAMQCEDDDAFVDDDNYDGLDAVSDSDESRRMTLIETLNIQTAHQYETDSEFGSDFDTTKGPLKFDNIFEMFGSTLDRPIGFEGANSPTLPSQQDDFLADFDKGAHKRNGSEGSGRKVRFEDEVYVSSQTSSAGSSEIRNEFPDLLLSQDGLDAPPFPRGPLAINDFPRGYISPNGSDASYWDVADGCFQPDKVHMSDSSESSPGSSGYESDRSYRSSDSEGETTEDEMFVPQTISQPDSLLHESSNPSRRRGRAVRRIRQSSESNWSDDFMPAFSRLKLPPRGMFRVNNHQRVAITDWTGTRLLMYNMGEPKCSCNSDRNCINGKPKQNSNTQLPVPQTPNTPAESMNMTFNNLVEDRPNETIQEQAIGPFEAFYPFYNVEIDGTVTQDQLDQYAEDDVFDDSEMDLDINNFISYGESDTDNIMEDASALQSPSTSEQEQMEADRRASSNALFEGYDSNTITSFRRNQDRAQQVSRMPEHPTLRRSSQVSNAYREGRDSAADSLITPPRRRRGDRSIESFSLQI